MQFLTSYIANWSNHRFTFGYKNFYFTHCDNYYTRQLSVAMGMLAYYVITQTVLWYVKYSINAYSTLHAYSYVTKHLDTFA